MAFGRGSGPQRDALVEWADRYLAVPRWIFATLYFLFAALGVTVIIISSPTIDLATGQGWNVIWGSITAGTASLCALFSLRPRFEVLERWSALGLCTQLVGYCIWAWVLVAGGGEQGINRGAFAICLTIMSFIPTVRLAYMILRVGKAPRLRGGPLGPDHTAGRVGLGLLLVLSLTAGQGTAAAAGTGGLDLNWVPGALALVGVLAMAAVNARNNKRDREGRRSDMEPPSWTDVYNRLDALDRGLRASLRISADVAGQWPDDAPPPVLSRSSVRAIAALDKLDDTLVPDELRALVRR